MSQQQSTSGHPLPREGTDRNNRVPRFLDPASTPIDDRSVLDFLVYAWRLCEHLKYVDAQGEEAGDWQAFLDSHPLVAAALLAREDFSSQQTAFNLLLDVTNPDFQVMLETLGDHLRTLERRATALDPKLTLGSEVHGAIGKRMVPMATAIIAAYKSLPNVTNPPVHSLLQQWRSFWNLDPDTIPADPAFPALTKAEKKTLLRSWYQDLHQTRIWLAQRAEARFAEMLEVEQSHEPTTGLLLTFLHLLREANDHLNDLTGRHLDHYFRDILRISPTEARPDEAWLLFELARHVDNHLLTEGTLFKAGKDDTDVERRYGLDKDTVLHRAQVAHLQTIYRNSDTDRIHAAPKANSADGQGEEFSDNPKWPLLGDAQQATADVGLAIAAPMLDLTGGVKTITLTFTLADTAALKAALAQYQATHQDIVSVSNDASHGEDAYLFNSAFQITATGEKDWLTLAPEKQKVVFQTGNKRLVCELTFGEDQALVPYLTKTHGEGFDSSLPLVRLLLNSDLADYPYTMIAGLQLSALEISASVVGEQNVIALNDFGPLNVARPFLPFGPRPDKSASFYLGGRALFSKKLDALALRFTWRDLPSVDVKTQGYFLHDAQWQPVGSSQSPFETNNDGSNLSYGSTDANPINRFPADPDLPDYKDKEAGQLRGFLKVTLSDEDDPFGHLSYPTRYAQYLADQISAPTITPLPAIPAQGKAPIINGADIKEGAPPNIKQGTLIGDITLPQIGPPDPPYVPEAMAFQVDYTTSASHTFGQSVSADTPQLLHIGPFGAWPVDAASAPTLLPHYRKEGRLYIALKETDLPQNIDLWFQLIEGGGNPFAAKPAVTWSYLKEDTWQDFAKTEILQDTTLGLTTTGVISFVLPTIDLHHTRKTSGLVWLRAVAGNDDTQDPEEHINALSPAVTIATQVGKAVFQDNGNDPAHLQTPLPAGTIKKLLAKDKLVKKINQPTPSFHGEPLETDEAFRIRVSERLRHKDRAVDSWDYEHLILQAFGEIHKVKCITHTHSIDERAPGHVTLALVPVLDPDDAYDPFRPAVSQATIARVKTFIDARKSKHVTTHVVNPLYEPIRVKAKIRLHIGFDPAFYIDRIIEDLKKFLAPWAFATDATLAFGTSLHRSLILNFLEELPYVDYLKDFRVDRVDEDGQLVTADLEYLVPATARSILVTANTHLITPIE